MMSVVIGFFYITGCDFWRLRAAWAKITEELEVQDC